LRNTKKKIGTHCRCAQRRREWNSSSR
jgi:hypothetical protein